MSSRGDAEIHSSAIVDQGAVIGQGTKIWHFTHVANGAVIGEGCSLGQNVYIAPKARLGNRVRVQNNVSVYDEVTLEDDVFCGPSCVFTNVINPRSEIPRKHEYKKTWVKKGATVGANATIICGTTLGEYCFIAAGAVVNRDVLPFELVGGVPIKTMGWMCQCGVRLSLEGIRAKCNACERDYFFKDGLLIRS